MYVCMKEVRRYCHIEIAQTYVCRRVQFCDAKCMSCFSCVTEQTITLRMADQWKKWRSQVHGLLLDKYAFISRRSYRIMPRNHRPLLFLSFREKYTCLVSLVINYVNHHSSIRMTNGCASHLNDTCNAAM